jgi:hypothetical protein
MSVSNETTKEKFSVSAKYNPNWNPHYDFTNPANLAEIQKMTTYDNCFKAVYGPDKLDSDSDEYKQAEAFLKKCNDEAGGDYQIGKMFEKDWGINGVIGVASEKGEEVVTKEIIVFKNCMLSLQSHNGRREEWKVTDGLLSLIADGDLYDVSDEGVFKVTGGKREPVTDANVARQEADGHWTFILQPGSIHCMINRGNENVTVVETQRGICREADNKRYVDQCRNNKPRATLPLTSELLFRSANIYWAVENEIAIKPALKAEGWRASYTPVAA